MTPQEQQMLEGLADRVNRTQLQEKDPDAETLIQQRLGRNRDALYIMAQTILVQQYALEQAQRQIGDLRAQAEQARQQPAEPKHATSFLGSLLGHRDEPQTSAPPPPRPMQPRVPPPEQAQYQQAPLYEPTGGYPIPGVPVQGGGGGFLRSAATTAAGVAAGALAFEGIESLMHGFGHAAGYGGGFGVPLEGGRPEEVINNYYVNDAGAGGHAPEDRRDLADQVGNDWDSKPANDTLHDPANLIDNQNVNPGENVSDADDLSGTGGDFGDYSQNADDSMLSDNVADQDDGSDFDSGGDDSGGDDFGGGGDDLA